MNTARRVRALVFAALIGLLPCVAAQAHLMVAQQGTLNLVGDGAYMVLSLPVSAFTGIDDNADGLLSPAELGAHASQIAATIQRGVILSSTAGPRPLEGLMLYLSAPEREPDPASRQVIALGRFALGGNIAGLKFRMTMFGSAVDERSLQMTVTRGRDAQLLVLAPGREERAVLPSGAAIFGDFILLGAQHVLTGFDHLLFLLVVLSAGWGLRRAALALTCFTAGHAITLAASVLGGVSVPASVVEPAIAATIVGMAVYDQWSARHPVRNALAVRLTLVFACALIHGLGFAGALSSLGLDTSHRALSLAGFNLGIETGQVVVALTASLLLAGIRQLRGLAAQATMLRLASRCAMLLGSVWFLQRVLA